MLKIKKIDHVAVCVANVADGARRWTELFGLEAGAPEHIASQSTNVVVMPGGSCDLEMVAPERNASLERFLEKRGPGLHHVALEVEDIEEAIAYLKGRGVAMIDEAPRLGARGCKVAFVHPKEATGVLVELVERPAGEPDREEASRCPPK
jgi:methylmalonyl-CoA/ethylmalonyl-CoA epimerase